MPVSDKENIGFRMPKKGWGIEISKGTQQNIHLNIRFVSD